MFCIAPEPFGGEEEMYGGIDQALWYTTSHVFVGKQSPEVKKEICEGIGQCISGCVS